MGCLTNLLKGCAGTVVLVVVVLIVFVMVFGGGTDDGSQDASEVKFGNSVTDQAQGEEDEDVLPPNVPSAQYEVYDQEAVEPPNGRTRWIMRIVMDPSSSREAIAQGIAEAVRQGESEQPETTCIVVFAYSYPTESDAVDIGRGFTSDDGEGLNGEGDGLLGPDREGEIQVEVITGDDPQLFRLDK